MLSRAKKWVRTTAFARQALWVWGYVDLKSRGAHYRDRLTVRVMKRVLGPDSVAIDVGANRGDLLRYMVKYSPGGRHYAFEPVPPLAEALRREFPHVGVLEVALSDEPGQARFNYVRSNPEWSGLDLNAQRHRAGDVELICVETARLDELIPPDLSVSFLKVDVEGGELRVFRGAHRILSTCRPVVVWEQGVDRRGGW